MMTEPVLSGARTAERRRGADVEVDPITVQLIKSSMEAAAEQMGVSLRRTAFSPMIYDTRDYTGAFYDRDLRLLAQMRCLPEFVGTLDLCIENAIKRNGGSDEIFEDGDVIVTNYSYDTGSHQLDIALLLPIFYDGELVAWAANKAHNLDVGAIVMFPTTSTDVWQEGTIIPSVRLWHKGELNEDLWRMMLMNSRLPDAMQGDISAQMGCLRVGAKALTRVLDRFGPETVWAAYERIWDQSEEQMRSVIRQIPDGEYTASGIVDNDGISDDPLPYTIKIEVTGDDILVDLTDCPPQTPGPINAPLICAISNARCGIMTVAGIDEGATEGHFRPLTVKTLPGTIFHSLPPAPTFMYSWPLMSGVDYMHRALAHVLPNRVPAETGCDVGAFLCWGHRKDGSYWGDGTNHAGGQGAALVYGDGGPPMMHITCSGTRNNSIEVYETRTPLLAERVELARDSGGVGRFRGGPGIDHHYRALEDVYFTIPWERIRSAPFGLFGGGEGRLNRPAVRRPDGSEQNYLKASGVHAPKGSLIILETGGGGGVGDPAERDVAAIRTDLEDEYVSEEMARRHYPHAFDGQPEQEQETQVEPDGGSREEEAP
jgi:N-methylhydantoinase B